MKRWKADPPTQSEKSYLLRVARQSLNAYLLKGLFFKPTNMPKALSRFNPFYVFVTLHVGGQTRGCYAARQSNLAKTVAQATINTVRDKRYVLKGVLAPDNRPVTLRKSELSKVRIEINIVLNNVRLWWKDADYLDGEISPGVHGVRLYYGRRGAFYLPYVQIQYEYGIRPLLSTLSRKARLKQNGWKWRQTRIYKYRVHNFIEEVAGGRPVDLYRNTTLITSLDRPKLKGALKRAGDFLMGMQKPDGAFNAWYYPKNKRYSYFTSWTDHLQTVISLARLSRFFSNDLYMEAARRGLAHALQKFDLLTKLGKVGKKPAPLTNAGGAPADKPEAVIRARPSGAQPLILTHAKISTIDSPMVATALLYTAMSLVESIPGAPKAEQIAQGLKAMWKGGKVDRKFRYQRLSWRNAHVGALQSIRTLAGKESSEKQRKFLSGLFISSAKSAPLRDETAADYLRSALLLYRLSPKSRWKKITANLASRLLAAQYTAQTAPEPDYIGTFNLDQVPRSLSTAKAGAALAELYGVMKDERFRRAAFRVVKFLLQLQFSALNAIYFDNTEKYLGGIRSDMLHNTVGLATTNSAVEAFLATYQLLSERMRYTYREWVRKDK